MCCTIGRVQFSCSLYIVGRAETGRCMYYMYVVCYLCKTADIVLYVYNTNFLRENKVYLILYEMIQATVRCEHSIMTDRTGKFVFTDI